VEATKLAADRPHVSAAIRTDLGAIFVSMELLFICKCDGRGGLNPLIMAG
jgi:hypothetical protein